MDVIDRAYDRACCEVDDLLKHQKFDKQDVELLGEFVDIIKDVEMIYGYQDDMGGYSQMNGNGYMPSRYGRGMSYGRNYNRGSSYTRNGNGYSRTDGKEMMIDHLQDIADMATDERDRKAVMRLMEQMQAN